MPVNMIRQTERSGNLEIYERRLYKKSLSFFKSSWKRS